MTDCTFPRCGCSEREQCRPEDALKAALARAEAAEAEVTRLQGELEAAQAYAMDKRVEMSQLAARAEAAEEKADKLTDDVVDLKHVVSGWQAAAERQREAAEDNLNSGRELLREAWSQLNAIRAWRGAPPGVSEDWFSQLVDDLGDLLKDERLPWMTAAAKALVAPYQRQIEQAQDLAIEAERQRDEAFTAGAEAMREACAILPGKWIAIFGDIPITALSPEKYAAAAVADIADAIRALPLPAQEGK